jgi:protein-L-isoaspartate(D-aspartate) O-methyltransferase
MGEVTYRAERRRLLRKLRKLGITNEKVLRAMWRVPRHEFVDAPYRRQAYGNFPLPLPYRQTISQPYVVAWMTELLALKPDDRILEIGTGSGYQTAVLAELAGEVFSVEIVPELAGAARATLCRLGYDQVHVRCGNGHDGWPEHAPYDAIIVTAAPAQVPPRLVDQLAPGGRMVVPVGPAGRTQILRLLRRTASGDIEAENLGGVRFVPFTGGDEEE